jgi:hypothetical protein
MIEFVLNYALFFSIFFLYFSVLGNSFNDALLFSGAKNGRRSDLLWHFVKYLVDRPFLFLSGVMAFQVLVEQWLAYNWDIFHYTMEFFIWVAFIVNSFVIWQVHYRWWKKYFRNKQ